MATSKTKTPTMSTTIAEFEALLENAKKTITESGQSYDEVELRKVLSEALGRAEEQAAAAPGTNIDVNAGGALKVTARKALGDRYWYEADEDRQMYEWFIEGSRNGTVEGNLLITGPNGSGKTDGVVEAGKRLNVPVHIINCASITSIEKWVGERGVDKNGTYFRPSDVIAILTGTDERFPPGIALFDEITRLHATYHNILFPVLDHRRRIWIPEMHEFIDVSPEVHVIATANIGGRFTGTFHMDQAMRDRFHYTLERDFPPKEAEVRILTSAVGIDDDHAGLMVDIAKRTRNAWRQGELTQPISTRALLAAARIVRDGGSIARAFEVTVLPTYSTDGAETSERTFVKGVISGKGGNA